MNRIERQQQLSQAMQAGLIVLTGYSSMQQSGDMAAPFLQEANFFWLTGIALPGWKAIIDSRRKHITLVRPTRSHIEAIFHGSTDEAELIKRANADEIIDEKECEAYLRQLARTHSLVYTPHSKRPYPFVMNPASGELHAQLERIFPKVEDCSSQLAELRAIKSPDEIAAIRRAVMLTCKTFADVRSRLGEYRHEYEIEADMTHAFRRVNAKHAYEPIVAAGKNAVTLHYIANNETIKKTQSVLMDVGARVDGYAADITRTYCTKPTKRLIAVHAAVEEAHKKIVALLAPDLLVTDYLMQVDEIMKDALQQVGLLENRDDTVTYRNYFPHSISHGLGIDVHDSLGSPRYFRSGMVLTVEPGIYIPEEGIGVRIEDDILITESGHENLSGHLPTAL